MEARAPTRWTDQIRLGVLRGLSLAILLLDALVDLLAMDRDLLGGVHADTHLVSLDPQDGDGDIVTDYQGFSYTSCQYEHLHLLAKVV